MEHKPQERIPPHLDVQPIPRLVFTQADTPVSVDTRRSFFEMHRGFLPQSSYQRLDTSSDCNARAVAPQSSACKKLAH